jgi:monofunctional biosynthetic peptidoglycan transglycosylase
MKILLRTFMILGLFVTLAIVAVLITAAWTVAQFPNDKEIRGCITTKMYHVHLCPNSPGYTPLSAISPYLAKTVVLSEDGMFWSHHGFDFEEMQRSFKRNLETGKYSRGGSTITQQLAKNLFLTEEKTLLRKFKEAIITLRLEQTLSKKEILERYLNVVHFGKNIFGVTEAAQFYFHKKPSQLSLVDCAFLTFLLPSPEKYSVSFSKGKLTPYSEKRIHQIIDSLYRYHKITDTEFYAADADFTTFMKNQDEMGGATETIQKLESQEIAPAEEPEQEN